MLNDVLRELAKRQAAEGDPTPGLSKKQKLEGLNRIAEGLCVLRTTAITTDLQDGEWWHDFYGVLKPGDFVLTACDLHEDTAGVVICAVVAVSEKNKAVHVVALTPAAGARRQNDTRPMPRDAQVVNQAPDDDAVSRMIAAMATRNGLQ